jgi:beta-1,4-mannosyltransferase
MPRFDARRNRPRLVEPSYLASGFAAVALIGFLASYFAIWWVQDFLWGLGRPALTIVDYAVVVTAAVGWTVSLPAAALGIAGLLLYGNRQAATARPMPYVVSFRVVSRGQNELALLATVDSIRAAMKREPLFPYRVEVITDMALALPPGDDLWHYVVPPEYETPRGSLYKARALEYALGVSDLPGDAWIMHLDEESRLSTSLVRGIAVAVSEEEASGRLRIGQGVILYHRDVAHHRFLTLADGIRTGDDLGRFHFQHRLGITLFGLHGSFILVRNDIASEVGFDFGPVGSITEDAFWAVVQMERGRRCRWVDGFLEEQSTRSLMDFARQRRRWFIGLVLVALRAPVKLRYRLAIGVSTAMWSMAWVGVVATYANLIVGVSIPLPLRAAGNFVFAFYIVLYLLGMKLSLNLSPMRWWARWLHYLGVVLLIPVFAIIEAASVIYALLRPNVGFHVVRK